MAELVIDYEQLAVISSCASSLAKRVDEYADGLTKYVANKINEVSGGVNDVLYSAKYFVEQKVGELENKKSAYENFAQGINNLIATAKSVDGKVASVIAENHDTFVSVNQHLEIEDWKAEIINWLVDKKNSCPIFDLICNGLSYIGTAMSSALDNLKYWYKCEGGKEIISFVAAIGGAVIAIALFVATLPASGFVAICAAIGAAITAINAIVNVATSYVSMISAKSGDPAWAKIYGDQNKFTDWLRQTRFESGLINRLSYGVATVVDGVELFCDIVNIVELIKKFKFKFDFLQNYFDKNTGLLSYMKTAKWKDVLQYDQFGNITGVTKVMKANEYGIVETHYTFGSVINGLKAYVMNKPIDARSDLGIRTLLNQNFATDFKMFYKSTFSVTAWKDTFRYKVTDGGRISYTEWKQSFSVQGIKDTLRYNLTHGSFKGVFAEGVEWENRKDFIETSANGLKSVMDVSEKFGSMLIGEYNIVDDIKGTLEDKAKDFSNTTKIIDKIGSVIKKGEGIYKDTYVYKSATN